MAEQLAATVSLGAEAAAQQARDLLEGLRLDVPDRAFAEVVGEICQAWSASARVPVRVTLTAPDPPVSVRYEFVRILQEALDNVERHARATVVNVSLAAVGEAVRLEVSDDSLCFAMPSSLSSLHAAGRFGIVGMTERARTIGGVLRVVSAPGRGTTITVCSGSFDGAGQGSLSTARTRTQLTTATWVTP